MITPRFKLSQTETSITISVRAPYCSLRKLEVTVEEEVFIFCNSPYYLRLHLPGQLQEDGFTESSFDADSGEYKFTIRKAIEGEHFPNLEMITKLLAPKIYVTDTEDTSRKITILTQGEAIQTDEDLNEEFGFALCGKKGFNHVSAEFTEVFEVDPFEMKLDERHKTRLKYEQGKFNIDHYLCDYIENDEIIEFLHLETPWCKLKTEEIEFNEKELDFLKSLPNKHYNLSETQMNYSHCSLIDILFAYCYDQRTTDFEGSSESGWNIIKLAASFCWLDVFKTPKDAVISCFRRAVIYPLYRNFELCLKVFEDLKQLLRLGEVFLIKHLIEMYNIFLKGDCCRYILNDLFIKDYIIYIMKWDQEKWRNVVSEVEGLCIQKSDLGLNLQELEDDVCQKLKNLHSLNITEYDSDDSDSSSDESTTEEESGSDH